MAGGAHEELWQRMRKALDRRGSLPAGNATAQEIARHAKATLGSDEVGRFVQGYYQPLLYDERASQTLSDAEAQQLVARIEELPIPATQTPAAASAPAAAPRPEPAAHPPTTAVQRQREGVAVGGDPALEAAQQRMRRQQEQLGEAQRRLDEQQQTLTAAIRRVEDGEAALEAARRRLRAEEEALAEARRKAAQELERAAAQRTAAEEAALAATQRRVREEEAAVAAARKRAQDEEAAVAAARRRMDEERGLAQAAERRVTEEAASSRATVKRLEDEASLQSLRQQFDAAQAATRQAEQQAAEAARRRDEAEKAEAEANRRRAAQAAAAPPPSTSAAATVETAPGDADSIKALATRYGKVGRLKESAQQWVAHADLMMRSGRPDEAIASLREALHHVPQSNDALRTLGALLHRKGDYQGAIAAYRETTVLAEDDCEKLGEAYMATGNAERAADAFRRSVAMDPSQARVWFALGNAAAALGLRGEAEKAFRQCLALDPNFPQARQRLGTLPPPAKPPPGLQAPPRPVDNTPREPVKVAVAPQPRAPARPKKRSFAGFFSMEGRTSLGQFWSGWLKIYIGSVMLNLFMVIGTLKLDLSARVDDVSMAAAAITLVMVSWPSLCLYVRRCHDRNKSGWWLLLWLVLPVVGWLWSFVEIGLLRGTPGRNRYGDPP